MRITTRARTIAGLGLLVCLGAIARCAIAGEPHARAIDELNTHLDTIALRVNDALNSEAEARSVVEQLDSLEMDFASRAADSTIDRKRLRKPFERLERLLSRIHGTYVRKANSSGCFEPLRFR